MGIGGVNSRQQNNSVNSLQNLYNYGFTSGKSNVAAGGTSMDQAGGYYSKLLSGNRTTAMSAIAPESNAVLAQGDAARRQQAASGTARGGGTAGANQQQQTQENATIDNALFAARPAAAEGEAKLGAQQEAFGLNQLQIGGTAAGNAGEIATKARSQAAQEQASAITAGIGLIFG